MATDHTLSDPQKKKKKAAADKKKGGRPEKNPEDKQEHVVAVRFTTAHYEQLAAHVRPKGLTMAGVVKKLMGQGGSVALTAEQHAWLRALPGLSNELRTIAELLKQQPDRQDQAAELLGLQARIGELLNSFQR